MSLWTKIKLLFQVKAPTEKLIDGIKDFKSGWKTIPFWITVVGSLTSIAAALKGVLPAEAFLVITTILGVIYNFIRGFEKVEQNAIRPMLLSTEFWVGTLTMAGNAITTLQTGGIDPQWLLTSQAIIAAAMAGAQQLGARTPQQ